MTGGSEDGDPGTDGSSSEDAAPDADATENGSLDAVVARVREQVDPDPSERAALRAAVERLLDRTREAVADLPEAVAEETDVLQVGSTARGTWIAGDRDVDVFVRFPPDLDRETLREYGLAVGNAVLPDGHEEYAEHPYVRGSFEGYDVDLVPCYRVESAAAIRSAVDRTPFHNRYLAERLDDATAAEVRVFKQFLKGIGVYGSDLRTRGFSGYLTELLVLEYGGFEATLAAAADWQPPVRLDPGDHGNTTFDDPLVVVDPTDPGRNVAAVVSETNVARLQHHARATLAAPAVERFFPESPEPLSKAGVREHLDRRGTTPVAVRFDPPDVVDDQLYPQLRRSLDGLVGGLEGAGFEVLRSATWADDSAVLFVELVVAELPAVERHEGPPVHVEAHARGFFDKYEEADVYGPFVEDGRYVVERERDATSAAEFVEDRLFEVALGKQVESALREGFDVLVGREGVSVLAGEFGVELAAYFDPGP